jgi:hypothetical protein
MNSISANLTPSAIAATARMLRSAKKEIIFIVEGDEDIALFSNSLGLPRSNFISCFGKERLMEVFNLVPTKGIDEGMIFLRDRDCDRVVSHTKGEVLILVSDLYDFEMSLLPKRVFGRIFNEFVKTKATREFTEASFIKVLSASARIGALRAVSHEDKLCVDFKEAKMPFLCASDLSVDIDAMVQFFLSRSKIGLKLKSDVSARVRSLIDQSSDPVNLSSGKDFLSTLSLALNKHFKCCQSSECTFATLSRMFRMTVVHDDLKGLALYPILRGQISRSAMAWSGHTL